jgi:hypothetical protein
LSLRMPLITWKTSTLILFNFLYVSSDSSTGSSTPSSGIIRFSSRARFGWFPVYLDHPFELADTPDSTSMKIRSCMISNIAMATAPQSRRISTGKEQVWATSSAKTRAGNGRT